MLYAVVERSTAIHIGHVRLGANRRLHERIATRLEAQARVIGCKSRLRVKVADLSPHGCKILAAGYSLGDEVMISLAHLASLRACVRWTTDGEAGLEFATPLHPSVVSHLTCGGAN